VSQLFHPSINSLAKASIAGVAAGCILVLFAATAVDRSPYVTGVHVAIEQPVPFSHQHHVGGLGIDCRYCHNSVEQSAFAGIPSTETCMTCHSQIWRESAMLAPVRESYATGTPIRWARVHSVPDYAYFQHDIHINKGVGCESCHGRVDHMPMTWKVNTLHMDWCLSCHRDPQPYIRPPEHVFEMGYQPPAEKKILAPRTESRITDCATCHR